MYSFARSLFLLHIGFPPFRTESVRGCVWPMNSPGQTHILSYRRIRIPCNIIIADRREQWASLANIMLFIATDCSIMIIKQQYDDIRQQFCGILFGYESSLCSYSPHEKRIKKSAGSILHQPPAQCQQP